MNVCKAPSLDSLFGGIELSSSTGDRICDVNMALIDLNPGNPFKPYTGAARDNLVEDIRQNGVLTPITLWLRENGRYLILAGQNRYLCSKLAGNTTIPSIIKRDITEGQAKLIVVHSNTQRGFTEWLPSERAFALKLELEGLKAERRNLKQIQEMEDSDEVYQLVHPGKSRDVLAKKYNLEPIEIQRIISLTQLCRSLLDLPDDKKITFRAALFLTKIPEEYQEQIAEAVREKGCKLDIAAAERIRALFLDGALNKGVLQEVLREQHPTPKQGKAVTFKMSGSSMQRYFPESLKKAEIAERIERALELSEIRIPQIIRQYRPETNQTEYSDILIDALQQYFSA